MPLLLACIAGHAAASPPDNPVRVELDSGRGFAGDIDSRTDDSRLWIRNELSSGHVARPIDWDRVVRVELAGEIFSGAEFRKAVRVVRSENPVPAADEAATNVALASADIILGPGEPHRTAPAVLPKHESRVQSLAVEAYLGNWDADVEPDGLILEVLPLDGQGSLVPAHGTVEIDLLAERVGVVQQPNPFHRIGRWTRLVAPVDFGPNGARYHLPFQSIDPDFDLHWASHGAVHVRLSVPGSGVFERTASMVRIRPYSSVRDRLEQTTGHRYFYLERTEARPR